MALEFDGQLQPINGGGDLANQLIRLKDIDLTDADATTSVVDADLLVIDDGATGNQSTTNKITAGNLKTYMQTGLLPLAGGALIGDISVTDTSAPQLSLNYDADHKVTFAIADDGDTTIRVFADSSEGSLVITSPKNITTQALGDIALSADGGNVTMDDGTNTIFDFDVDNTSLTIKDDANTADYFKITVGNNGMTNINTTDASGHNLAHLSLVPSGNINISPTTKYVIYSGTIKNSWDKALTAGMMGITWTGVGIDYCSGTVYNTNTDASTGGKICIYNATDTTVPGWEPADCTNAEAYRGMMGFVMLHSSSTTSNDGKVLTQGLFSTDKNQWNGLDNSTDYKVGSPIYLSSGSKFTLKPPSGSGDFIRVVGHVAMFWDDSASAETGQLTSDGSGNTFQASDRILVHFNPSSDWVELS
jgi:hypothetical protein